MEPAKPNHIPADIEIQHVRAIHPTEEEQTIEKFKQAGLGTLINHTLSLISQRSCYGRGNRFVLGPYHQLYYCNGCKSLSKAKWD